MLLGPTRQLFWFPIIHTQADLGGLGSTVRQVYVERAGRDEWDRHRRLVEGLWRNVREQLNWLNLTCECVCLYQDGLPRCGREEEIVRDLARLGSENHRILLELIGRGARLVGTESPELLLEEYELTQQVLLGVTTRIPKNQARRQHERGKALLGQRDAFIAARVGETLAPGATGLIFLGLLHDLEGRLPPDVKLTRMDSIPAQASPRGGPSSRQRRQGK